MASSNPLFDLDQSPAPSQKNPLFGLDNSAEPQVPTTPTQGNPLFELGRADDRTVSSVPSSQPPSYDVPKSFGSGIVSGVEQLAGLPGDIRHAADYGVLWAEAKAAEKLGYLPKGQTAEDMIQKYRGSAGRAFMSQLGVPDRVIDWMGAGAPTTAEVHGAAQAVGVPSYTPQTVPGQYAHTIGSFVPGALAVPAEGIGSVAGNVARYALVPGAASEVGGQWTRGTPAEPFARIAAGVAGGSAGALLESAGRAGIQGARDFIEPLTEQGRQAIAARKLQGAFTDPRAASQELAAASALQVPGAGLGEIVLGSRPTTGQLTGDQGALQLEREFATRQPDLYRENEFGTGAQQQNAARMAALRGIQPTGSPAEIGQVIRQQMATIDAQHSNTVQGLLAQAQQSASGIGAGVPPEALGANLRSALQNARDTAKANERGLWNAVDPDGTLSLPAAPVVNGASRIIQSIPQSAKPMGGEEAAIFQAASSLPATAPFSEMTALRSRISAAMRDEVRASGQSPTYARLSQLRGTVESAIENAAQNKAIQEAQAVSRGAMSPDETMIARLEADRAQYYQRAAAAQAGPSARQGASGNAGSGSSAFRGVSGAAIPPGGGPGIPSGNQGIPPDIWDEAAAERLRAASAATKARAQTFDQGPVGDVLRKGQTASDYRLPESAVPGRMFVSGPRGYQTGQAYQAAAGSGAMDPLLDTAAESLRREAMTSEGVIDPARFANWQTKYSDALRSLPPALQARFSNAASATQAYQDAAAARKTALDAFEKTTAGKFLGLSDPQDIGRTVGGLFGVRDSVAQMQSLARSVSANPVAQEGLRKAVADHILSVATGAMEAGTSGINNLNAAKLYNFLARNSQTIKAAGFSDSELQNMTAIAKDLQRSQRTLQATKLPGQSNTAQDVIANIERAQSARPMSLLAKVAAATYLGGMHAGAWGATMGAASAAGEHLMMVLRGAGLAKANTLVRDAMLDPELARDLLKVSPFPRISGGDWETLSKALARNAVFGAMAAERGKGYAKGGSVKSSHDRLVSRLMSLAETAKREEKARTKSILGVPDDAVTTALARANAAI